VTVFLRMPGTRYFVAGRVEKIAVLLNMRGEPKRVLAR